MNFLAEQLLDIMNICEDKTSDYRIARYLLEHLEKVDTITSGQLANECSCSKSTVTRFCERLGLKDFYELKTLYYVVSHGKTEKYYHLKSSDLYFEQLRTLEKNIQKNIDNDTIYRLCEDIDYFKNVYLLGMMQSSHVAMSFQHDLYALRRIVECKMLIQDQKRCLTNSTEEDLIIIFSNTGLFFDRMGIDMQTIKGKVYILTEKNKGHLIDKVHLIDLNLSHHYINDALSLKILASYIINCYVERKENAKLLDNIK